MSRCSRMSKQKADVVRHILSVFSYMKGRPNLCFCGSTFSGDPKTDFRHFMDEHVKDMSVSYPPPLCCIYCCSKFESPEQLGVHHMTVHNNDDKPFFCPRCNSDIVRYPLVIHNELSHPGKCVLCLEDDVAGDDHGHCMKACFEAAFCTLF